jgi:uncharacterized protein YqgC (DUF456 family)
MDTSSVLLLILAAVIVVTGLVGLVIPLLPGAFLIFAGLVFAAWVEDFAYVGGITITILAILMILTYLIDFLAGAFGAKRFGGSRRAIIGATIGAIIGIFFGLIGIIIGPFIGAVIGQLSVQNNLQDAGRAGFGTWLGLVLGIASKVTIGFIMIGIYLLARLF